MTKNPFWNALAAIIYIALVVSTIFYAPKSIDSTPSVIIPILMISLFTLSAAVMAYLFLYTPLALYFDNHKKEAVTLFLKTVVMFAGIMLVICILFFSGIFN